MLKSPQSPLWPVIWFRRAKPRQTHYQSLNYKTHTNAMCTSSATSQKGHNAGRHPSANKPCLLRQTKAPRELAYSQHCQQATGQRHHPWCQTNGFPFVGAHFLQEWYNWKVNPELEFVRLYIERLSNHSARKTGELPQNKTMSQLLALGEGG